MKTNKPYIIRALNDWINDNRCTPYLLVDAEFKGVTVPTDYVKDGEIVLNLKPEAVLDLNMSNREITFRATFAGEEWLVVVPMQAVKAIYAKENPQGMMFDPETDDVQWDDDSDSGSKSKGRSHLKVVK